MKYDDIKTSEQLYEYMKNNIKYGFLSSQDNKTYTRLDVKDDRKYENLLFNTYKLQTPHQLLQTKCGLCYDQVEFERKWFEDNGYRVKTYFTPFHNHAFLIFIDTNGYNWFERTIKEYNGIHTKTTLEEILEYYKIIQLSNSKNADISLYSYNSVVFGSDFEQFVSKIIN